jgi:cardiolipin synthase (CMP-forming)
VCSTDSKSNKLPENNESQGLDIQSRDWLKLPNLLSLARLGFAIPAVILLLSRSEGTEHDHLAALLLILSFITDGLDGIVARLLNQRTDLGKILDPVIDKVVVISVAVTLVLTEREHAFPAAVLVAMVIRDASIVTLATRAWKRNRHLFASRWLGKVTMFVVSTTLLVQLVADWLPDILVITLPWVAFALLLLSSVDYLAVYVKLKRSKRTRAD